MKPKLKLVEAIATEAGTAETVKQGSVHEGAGRRHRPETAAEIAARLRSRTAPDHPMVIRQIERREGEIWL